jgi:catalase
MPQIAENGQRPLPRAAGGILVTSGADAAVLAALRSAAESEGAHTEIIAPVAGGVDASDGTVLPGRQIDGAPSVLFDAVAIIAAPEGARTLAAHPAARDFVSDAYTHCKFIGYTSGAAPLLQAAGVHVNGEAEPDDGFISLDKHPAEDFITHCRQLRFWDRQQAIA